MIGIENLFSDKHITKEASTGQWQTYRTLEGDPFAGTGTKAELVELERRMREIIATGLYPYMTMENQLISHGYGQEKIRCLFKKLTGLTPEEFQNPQGYIESPPEIPRLSVAWGLSKKKDAIAYFIQPWNFGYAIFCQKDDRTRDIIAEFDSRGEALDKLAKYTKEVVTYNKPMDLKLTDPDLRSLGEPKPIGTKTAAAKQILDHFDMIGRSMQHSEKLSIIKNAFQTGSIPEEDYITLLKLSGVKMAAEQVDEKEHSAEMDKPVDVAETPDDFLNSVSEDKRLEIGSVFNEIESFIAEVNKDSNDSQINIKGIRYLRKDLPVSNSNISTASQTVNDVFNTNGIISVILECQQLDKPVNTPAKFGVAVFSVVGDSLVTSGQFKGENDKLYSLNGDGVLEYLKSE